MKRREALFACMLSMLIAGCWSDTGATFPVSSGNESELNLYIDPEPVSISGFGGSAMEPFISLDGKFLFFNTDDDRKAGPKSLHFAARTGPAAFRYLGEFPGVNAHLEGKLDAVPSADLQEHFFFVSTRQYEKDFHSVFAGDIGGTTVSNVHAVQGDITLEGTPGLINMDVGISPDGNTLYISRTRFRPSVPDPTASDLLMARREGDVFNLDPRSAEIMKNVNTAALEYAPAISANGLELYFTRASDPEGLRIMVASRSSVDQPFGTAFVIPAISGFVEGPTVSLDGTEMFFHKKVDGTFRIFRAVRNPNVYGPQYGLCTDGGACKNRPGRR